MRDKFELKGNLHLWGPGGGGQGHWALRTAPLLCEAAAMLGPWKAGESLAERSLPGLVISVGSRPQQGWQGRGPGLDPPQFVSGSAS